MSKFCIAVDLGQAQERTAMVIMEYLEASKREKSEFHVRYIERFRIGTSYKTMIERILELRNDKPLSGSMLIIDGTGVGRPVINLFERQGLYPDVAFIMAGDAVEGGSSHREHYIPKKDLISLLQILFQDGRIKIAQGLPDGDVLTQELTSYARKQVRLRTSSVDPIELWREGVDDDLVLATALACWWCEEGIGDDIGFHF